MARTIDGQIIDRFNRHPYYNFQNALHNRIDACVGTLVIGVHPPQNSWLLEYRIGKFAIIVDPYKKDEWETLLDWGPANVLYRVEKAKASALVPVRPEDFELPAWIATRRSQIQENSGTACRFCGTDPAPGVRQKGVGDSAEECALNGSVPRWVWVSKCCGVQIGDWHSGYRVGAMPMSGFGSIR